MREIVAFLYPRARNWSKIYAAFEAGEKKQYVGAPRGQGCIYYNDGKVNWCSEDTRNTKKGAKLQFRVFYFKMQMCLSEVI